MKFMSLIQKLISFGLCLQLFGCAELLENRSFIDQMDHQTENVFVPGQDFDYTPGDSGTPYRTREEIAMRTPASDLENSTREESSSLYRELSFKERKLNLRERELYNEVMPYLETPSEKIYFLSLTPNQRRDYLDSRRIDYAGSMAGNFGGGPSRGLASLQPVYSSALQLGMTKDQVMSTWGRPARVEVAGNPRNENERWSFYENGQVKFVYFEGGAVQGWNLN